jgi:hypothetical protein
MEFHGIIYEKKHTSKGLNSLFNSSIDYKEYPIDKESFKKYKKIEAWIISCSYDYLQKLDINPYIRKSKLFAKISFSEEKNILRFELIAKGYFKKHLVIIGDQTISSKGIKKRDIENKSIRQILDELLNEFFLFNADALTPDRFSFIKPLGSPVEPKMNSNQFFKDFSKLLVYPKGILYSVFSLIGFFMLLKIFFFGLYACDEVKGRVQGMNQTEKHLAIKLKNKEYILMSGIDSVYNKLNKGLKIKLWYDNKDNINKIYQISRDNNTIIDFNDCYNIPYKILLPYAIGPFIIFGLFLYYGIRELRNQILILIKVKRNPYDRIIRSHIQN